MAKYLEIESTDNTNVLVVSDKVQYILQKKDCCIIGLDNGERITTGAKFDDLRDALKGCNRHKCR